MQLLRNAVIYGQQIIFLYRKEDGHLVVIPPL